MDRVSFLIGASKLVEARAEIERLMLENPEDTQLLYAYAGTLQFLKEYSKAVKVINQAIGINPEMAELHYLRGKMLIDTNQLEESEKSLQEAIRINPESADFYAYLALNKFQNKKNVEALEAAEKSLSLDPGNTIGHNLKGVASLRLNDEATSFNAFSTALKEDPTNVHAFANFGYLHLEKGRIEEAILFLKEALKIEPNYAYARSGLIQAAKMDSKTIQWMISNPISKLANKIRNGIVIGFGYLMIMFLFRWLGKTNEIFNYLNYILLGYGIFHMNITTFGSILLKRSAKYKHLISWTEIWLNFLLGLHLFLFVLGAFLAIINGSFAYVSVMLAGFASQTFLQLYSLKKFKKSAAVVAIVCSVVTIFYVSYSIVNDEFLQWTLALFLIAFLYAFGKKSLIQRDYLT